MQLNDKDFALFKRLSEVHHSPTLDTKARSTLQLISTSMNVSYSKLLSVIGTNLYLWHIYDHTKNSFISINEHKIPLLDIATFDKQQPGRESISGHVAATNVMQVIPSLDEYAFKTKFCSLYFESQPIKSELVIPILYRTKVMWVLCLSSTKMFHFSSSDTHFYEIIGSLLSSLLTIGFDSMKNAKLSLYDALVLKAWRNRTKVGHTKCICDLLRELGNRVLGAELSLYLKSPGNQNSIIKYGTGQEPPKDRLRIIPIDSKLFKPTNTDDISPIGEHITFNMHNHRMSTIGFLIAKRLHAKQDLFLKSCIKRCATETDALLKDERSSKSAQLRLNLISYQESDLLINPFDRIRILANRIAEWCNYKQLHFWTIETQPHDIARLTIENTPYTIRKNDSCHLTDIWKSGKVRFAYNISDNRELMPFQDLMPEFVTSWIGYPLQRGGKIVGILSCFGGDQAYLTQQDISAIEIAAVVLSMELELAKAHKDLYGKRMVESHQMSSHLGNASAKVKLLRKRIEKDSNRKEGTFSSLRRTVYDTHLRNVDAFLDLAIRNFHLQGRDIGELSDFHPREYSVKQIVAETVNMVRALLYGEEKPFNIRYTYFEGVVMFDRTSVQESLIAILLNAAKYSLHNDIDIDYFKIENLIEIRNIGIGIHPDDVDIIFDKGIQGRNVTRNMALDIEAVTIGHKGIGLWVAREMMRRTGGEVKIHQCGRCFSMQELLAVKFRHQEFEKSDYTVFHIVLPKTYH